MVTWVGHKSFVLGHYCALCDAPISHGELCQSHSDQRNLAKKNRKK